MNIGGACPLRSLMQDDATVISAHKPAALPNKQKQQQQQQPQKK